nr:RdRp [signal crayfish associated tombus-like virus 4]
MEALYRGSRGCMQRGALLNLAFSRFTNEFDSASRLRTGLEYNDITAFSYNTFFGPLYICEKSHKETGVKEGSTRWMLSMNQPQRSWTIKSSTGKGAFNSPPTLQKYILSRSAPAMVLMSPQNVPRVRGGDNPQ